MARSGSPLPGPILELSTENLHLNELSVDQLAALWNVFTKVGDSLHKGRRLENFVWRMWHREAHLLPPDSSWSDYADCTPLETPALSRAGSISQSYHFRPVMTQAITAAAAACSDNIPSDPEEGAGWSDESSDDEGPPPSQAESSTAISSRPPKPTDHRLKQVTATGAPPSSQTLPHSSPQCATRHSRKSSSNQSEVTSPTAIHSPSPLRSSRAGSLHLTAASSTHPHERKRNSSTSAAFGSRSRVRHLNPNSKAVRRRPISFQAALESLTNGTESEDLARLAREHRNRGMGAPYERRSYQGVTPIDILTPSVGETGASSKPQQPDTDEAAIAAATASHSSAPAASTLDDQIDGKEPINSAAATNITDASSKTTPLYIQPKTSNALNASTASQTSLADRHPPEGAEASEAGKKEKKKAKFFLSTSASRSLGDDDVEPVSAASVSPAPPHEQQQQKSSTDNGPESALSKAEGKMVESPTSSAAAPSQKQTKPKGETKQPASGMAPTHRNKSGAALHKHASGATRARASQGHGHTHGHGLGHGRQASSHRLTGLTMTKTHPPVQHAPPAAKGAAPGNKSSTRSRPKFTMGDDGEDEEEFTDESADDPEPARKDADRKGGEGSSHPPTGPSRPSTQPEARQRKVSETSEPRPEAKNVEFATDDGDDEEGWSSDTSAEAEDERQRIAAETMRRKKAEEERQRDLFKKVPVRSASAADVRHLQSGSEGAPAPPSRSRTPQPAPDSTADSAAVYPARGLLSSLFHPEQEARSPPGQLHGRPHASAADLRVKPDRPPSRAGHKSERRHRPPSLIVGTPGAHHHHHHHHHRDESRASNGESSQSQDKAQTSSNDSGGGLRMSKSAVALPVLNTAASMTGGGSSELTSREESELLQQQQPQRQQQVSQGDPHRQAMRRGHSSQGSNSQQAPPVAMPAPTLAPHRAALPTPAAPQTPRTTRRNMLRDELSESLRQNLLWERQSRNRMLGIGANGPREAPMQHPASQAQAQPGGGAPRTARRETVLGGNQLRPLTRAPPASTSVTTKSGSAGDDHRGPSTTTTTTAPRGEHSRSTSHLSDLSSQRGRDNGHSRGGSKSSSGSSHPRPSSQPYGENVSAETSEDEDDIRKSQSLPGDNDDDSSDDGYSGRRRPTSTSDALGPGGMGNSSMTSSGSASTLTPSLQQQQQPKQKKKTMWPGGFPNYHQHGW